MRRWCTLLLLMSLLLLASCQRAQRLRGLPKADSVEKQPKTDPLEPALVRLSWRETRQTPDLPIVFVADAQPEWAKLKGFWNLFDAGMPTAHLGLEPLPALAALVLAEHHAHIKIKVPLGLPDPATHIPASNPPTWGKWRLGAKLFHDSILPVGSDFFSCAKCHIPEKGFSDGLMHTSETEGRYNTLSLINVVYNRRQFWDGRVGSLEETLVRNMNDERPVDAAQNRDRAFGQHNWGGMVRKLVESQRYQDDFEQVFGLDQPTQDAAAKALATYMRTILAGNSLFDRAVQLRKNAKTPGGPLDFQVLLGKKDKASKDVPVVVPDEPEKPLTPEDLSAMTRGHALFHGKARCAACHTGPLFTDSDYHNVGTDDVENWPKLGGETGRAVHVPVGQKEARLRGAFRTPTLRNLAATGPYFHNGSLYTVPAVIKFFDEEVQSAPHLAQALKIDGARQRLNLSDAEKNDLGMFLRALQGTPVDGIVAAPPK